MKQETAPLLQAKGLYKSFRRSSRQGGGAVQALQNVSIHLEAGHTLGVVGESGCGKSTLAKIILGLLLPDQGSVLFQGEDVLHCQPARRRELRRQMQMVFQDPYASLDPCMTVGALVAEPLILNANLSKGQRQDRVLALLERVGLDDGLYNRLAQECSGGQRQRIGIARAIALQPKLVVCDEPVSALDMSIQSQILNLLRQLQADYGLSYLFISHDLSVIRHISDTVCVMYLGAVMEWADKQALYTTPLHPYTRCLLESVPRVGPGAELPTPPIEAGPLRPPEQGCPFAPRCPQCMPECRVDRPPLTEAAPGHFVACRLCH